MTNDHGSGEYEAATVRPYMLTGGRTRSVRGDLPMEALVESVAPSSAGRTSEQRDILAIATGGFQSVAELSAHTQLPLGVVRVLIGDLEAAGLVQVHGLSLEELPVSVTPLSVLESVLDGICAL